MPDPKHISAEDAHDEGVYGTIHDTIENDAYTVKGQGPETAKREREQLHELKHDARLRSQGGDESEQQPEPEPAPTKTTTAKSSGSTSGSTSGSSSS